MLKDQSLEKDPEDIRKNFQKTKKGTIRNIIDKDDNYE